VSGPNCLKGTDKKGLAKSFYPYLHMAPRGLDEGRVTFSFAARLPEHGAVPFTIEMRGKGGTAETGPSLAFAADGGIKANGRPVGALAPSAWTRFAITFTLSPTPSKGYTLTIEPPENHAARESHTSGGVGAASGNTMRLDLPYASPSFAQLGWIGITAPADADGCFYLDAVKLAVTERFQF
jgi:hypothetical protein